MNYFILFSFLLKLFSIYLFISSINKFISLITVCLINMFQPNILSVDVYSILITSSITSVVNVLIAIIIWIYSSHIISFMMKKSALEKDVKIEYTDKLFVSIIIMIGLSMIIYCLPHILNSIQLFIMYQGMPMDPLRKIDIYSSLFINTSYILIGIAIIYYRSSISKYITRIQ